MAERIKIASAPCTISLACKPRAAKAGAEGGEATPAAGGDAKPLAFGDAKSAVGGDAPLSCADEPKMRVVPELVRRRALAPRPSSRPLLVLDARTLGRAAAAPPLHLRRLAPRRRRAARRAAAAPRRRRAAAAAVPPPGA